MRTKPKTVVGGMASSLATNTEPVTSDRASQTTATVQSQQSITTNTYRPSSVTRTFVCAANTHHLFKQK